MRGIRKGLGKNTTSFALFFSLFYPILSLWLLFLFHLFFVIFLLDYLLFLPFMMHNVLVLVVLAAAVVSVAARADPNPHYHGHHNGGYHSSNHGYGNTGANTGGWAPHNQSCNVTADCRFNKVCVNNTCHWNHTASGGSNYPRHHGYRGYYH